MVLQRILVIDASPAMRETITAILADEYDVGTASESHLFERRGWVENPPDLLILGASDLVLENLPLLPQEIPVLWLASRSDWTPPYRASPARTVSRAFVPAELRLQVDELLRQRGSQVAALSRNRLQYPFLSREAAAVAQHAVTSELPVLVCGGRGTGRSSLARQLHELGTQGPFVTGSLPWFDDASPTTTLSGTLFLDEIERLDRDTQQRLLASLGTDGMVRRGRHSPLRLLAATQLQPESLADGAALSLELYYRVAVLIIELTPLRDRPQDIPALARLLGDELARRLGIRPVPFTEASLDRLASHLWFGDVAELEAVVARTLLLAKGDAIDAADLIFDFPRSQTRASSPSPLPSPVGLSAPDPGFDLVINELAHELKNPMVSVKTFAQHLRRMGFRGADEEQVAKLAGEAIDQMDQLVENLVQFTRFAEPARERVSLAAVLGPAVANLAQLLKPRSRRIDYRPPPERTIFVDRNQVIYGLANLFRALARGLGDTGRMTIGGNDQGHVIVELPNGYDSSEAQLAALLANQSTTVPLPLPAALAKQMIERNGGRVVFEADSEPPKVTVQLPEAQEQEVPFTHAQAPRSHR